MWVNIYHSVTPDTMIIDYSCEPVTNKLQPCMLAGRGPTETILRLHPTILQGIPCTNVTLYLHDTCLRLYILILLCRHPLSARISLPLFFHRKSGWYDLLGRFRSIGLLLTREGSPFWPSAACLFWTRNPRSRSKKSWGRERGSESVKPLAP